MRPPGIKNNQDDYKDERLGDILREIEKYDIVCFQEMFGWGSSRRDKLIEEVIKRSIF
jgi:endonuclease/exonuclease/phosphatase family metal-dependent hydrolase